ncbi:hypothetical protein [Methylogaea oryzae]|uniref:Uncharacterized protein n=1 Tax=Methylogaea oryzae TaxID=1295382 RepID=A0A8D4VRK8_9GAMM|nr:hypothetical protein [Methylogaea oryzae]BBL72427.1 hypothetical protein MoryE10_30330 [Methylogaea oryzae]
MLQIDSLTFVLLSELTIGLVLGILAYLIWLFGRKRRERAIVRDFIESLKETEQDRIEELKQRLRDTTTASDEVLAVVLDEFNLQENTLYKQVIEVFLHRNMKSVMDIDTRIRAITEPFCKLLADAKGGDEAVLRDLTKARRLMEEQNVRITRLRFEANQLSEQLATALETLDEVSSEYQKMFGASKSAEELEVSQKKVLNIFRQAEMRIKQITLNKDDSSAAAEAEAEAEAIAEAEA